MTNYKPDIKEIGADYEMTWPDLKLKASVSHIHQNFRGILAEIDIHHDEWGILRGGVELTLGSQSSQKELVASIKRRTRDSPLEVDWDRIVEAIAIVTKRQYRNASIDRLNLVHHMVASKTTWCLFPFIQHDAINIIFGSPGSAKSYLALALGLSVMTGEKLASFVPNCRHNILYLDWEDTASVHGTRARRLIQGAGSDLSLKVDDIPYIRCYRGLSEITADLQRVIAEDNIELLVIDSAVYAASGDPNTDDTVRSLTSALRQLNCTSLIIAHDTKDSKGIRGSKMWEAMARNIFEVKLESVPGTAEISVGVFHRKSSHSAKHPSIGYSIRFDNEADTTTFIRDASALTASTEMAGELTTKERIDSVLEEAMTKTQIIEALKYMGLEVSPKTIENTLSRWGKKGDYVKITNGSGAPLWGKARHESFPTLFPS